MTSVRRRERKVVTVLFCDLVGFTTQAEALDPEDVEALLRPYHSRVRAELERHGGTVEKFIGDAVMALFGAPVAHEDDPERAVRAALAIRDFALEEGLELRVGITTGEALVSLDAHPEAGEGMASGDVVNTAARLQAAAPTNGVLVDETTWRATRAAIEYEEAEPVEAKGKTQPIPVRLAREARARVGVDVAHEARSELVGRERELGVLRDAFERARHGRTPQLVTLVGVPGIGKSRLVYELRRIVDADPELVTWRQGRCLAYGGGVTLWALGEVVKAQAGIAEQDSPEEVRARIGRSVADALAGSGDEAWVASHLLALVGLAEEAELGGNRRDEAFAAWRRYLEALAEQRPLVLVFEDLHWADETLLDFVHELVDWITDVPLLVVCTARPELLERRPGWGGGKLNAATLGLAPLSDEDTARLLAALVMQPLLEAEAQRGLLERAGGNPLYAEQFADLYLERGSVEDAPLPETLQGIIAARVDGLPPAEKELLRDASVVGKVFWAGALADGGDPASTLHALERKGFVRRQRRSSLQGESELAFAHALVRDVAYGQIARAERADKHRRVAEWIEALGRPEDHAEMLAHHYSTALELARAAGAAEGDLVQKTRLALREAGDRSFGLNAYPAAASYDERALELWPDDEERPQLLYRRADSRYLADDARAESALEEARDALLATGDRETAAEAELALSRIWWHRGQNELADAHLKRAEELVAGSSSAAAARVLAHIARTRTIAGESTGGLQLAKKALALAEALDLEDVRAHALASIGLAKTYLGDPTGAEDELRALEVAVAAHSPVAGSIANNVAVQAFFEFDIRRAAELTDEGLRIAERFGDASGVRWLRAQRTSFGLMLGHWDDALELADAFIAECEAGSPHYLETRARIDRGAIREGRGDHDGALVDVEWALALVRAMSDPQAILAVVARAVAVFEACGRGDEARRLLAQHVSLMLDNPLEGAITIALELPDVELVRELEAELRDVLDRAPLPRWKEVGLLVLDRDFVGAADMWAESGGRTREARLRLRAAEVLLEQGLGAEADVQASKALHFYRSVGATFLVERAEQLLAERAAQIESA